MIKVNVNLFEHSFKKLIHGRNKCIQNANMWRQQSVCRKDKSIYSLHERKEMPGYNSTMGKTLYL